MTTKIILENIATITAAVTGITIIWTATVKGRAKGAELKLKFDSLFELPDRFLSIEETLGAVKKEVLPNGGTSFRDVILDRVATLAALNKITRETLKIAIYECDETGKTSEVNESLCNIFGLSKEEMLQNGWLYSIPEKERELVWKNWMFAVENKCPYRASYRIINQQDKKAYLIHTSASPITNDDGSRVLRYIGSITSVEEIKMGFSRE